MLWLCLLQGLDAETLEDRERAVRDLIEREDEPAARQALNSSDPEVRARAAEVLEALRWNLLEGGIGAFLASEECPPDDVRRLRADGLRNVRIYRCGERILALQANGDKELSEPYVSPDFALRALRNVRARTPSDRLRIARASVLLMDPEKEVPPCDFVSEDAAEVSCGLWILRYSPDGLLEGLMFCGGKLD